MIESRYFTEDIEINYIKSLRDIKLRIPVDFKYDTDETKKTILDSILSLYIVNKNTDLKIYETYIKTELINTVFRGEDWTDFENSLVIDLKINKRLDNVKKKIQINTIDKIKIKVSHLNRELQIQTTFD